MMKSSLVAGSLVTEENAERKFPNLPCSLLSWFTAAPGSPKYWKSPRTLLGKGGYGIVCGPSQCRATQITLAEQPKAGSKKNNTKLISCSNELFIITCIQDVFTHSADSKWLSSNST